MRLDGASEVKVSLACEPDGRAVTPSAWRTAHPKIVLCRGRHHRRLSGTVTAGSEFSLCAWVVSGLVAWRVLATLYQEPLADDPDPDLEQPSPSGSWPGTTTTSTVGRTARAAAISVRCRGGPAALPALVE